MAKSQHSLGDCEERFNKGAQKTAGRGARSRKLRFGLRRLIVINAAVIIGLFVLQFALRAINSGGDSATDPAGSAPSTQAAADPSDPPG